MPAYSAEKTLGATLRDLTELVDIRIGVDDHSTDRTVELARELGLSVFVQIATTATAAISRPATARRSPPAPTSWSCSIRTISKRRWWSRPW